MAEGKTRLSRPRGRPALPADEVKRHALGFRTTKRLKDALQKASDESGRSVAQEIEFRLEQSFRADSAEHAAFGGKRAIAVFRALAATAEVIDAKLGGHGWLEDWETFETVRNAWTEILKMLAPKAPENLAGALAAKAVFDAKMVPDFDAFEQLASQIDRRNAGSRDEGEEPLAVEVRNVISGLRRSMAAIAESATGHPALVQAMSSELHDILRSQLAKVADRSVNSE